MEQAKPEVLTIEVVIENLQNSVTQTQKDLTEVSTNVANLQNAVAQATGALTMFTQLKAGGYQLVKQ